MSLPWPMEVGEWEAGVSQIPNVALIVMPEKLYTDTLILGTLSLSEFSISIGIRLLFGENQFRFNFTADLQNSERKKSKKDQKKFCHLRICSSQRFANLPLDENRDGFPQKANGSRWKLKIWTTTMFLELGCPYIKFPA